MFSYAISGAYFYACVHPHRARSVDVASVLDIPCSKVPFIILFDGIVSCLRTYTPAELETLGARLKRRLERNTNGKLANSAENDSRFP